MKTSELLTRIAEAIKDNQALTAFCQEHFRRAPEVRIGLDPETPPDRENYPVVNIFRMSHSRSNNIKRRAWAVLLGVGVCAPGSAALDNGVIVINGELLAEDMRELAEEAVFNAMLGKVETSSDVPDGVPLPYHLCWSTLQFDNIP